MAQITIHRTKPPAIARRQSKYAFFHQLAPGGAATVSTVGMTEQERWRTLRSLRSIATYHRRAYGRQFQAAFSSAGIQVERLS